MIPTKISRSHLDRVALVYVRQSSLAQVREHTESTARQYALAEQATALGWAPGSVQVIDADLGVSGRSTEGRDGFRYLVSRVCLGEVGAVFGLEVSRLARSTADLTRLLELARLTDTLLIDGDGVYDLTDFNDRLLLGLKGTMSEAELHLLAGRLHGAKKAAAARGELRCPLPVGYVRDADEQIVIDPDEQVAAAVADVFAFFQRTGSAFGVVKAFTGRTFPLRAYGGVWAGQLRWGRLTHARVLGVLNNPCYAGAYVYGRYRSVRRVDPDGGIHSGIRLQSMNDWQVADPRAPPRLHRLDRVPGQPGPADGEPHRHRSPTTPGRHRPVSGHHRLRQLRPPDDRALPARRARRLRMPLPDQRPGHRHLPLDQRRHDRRGRRAPAADRADPGGDRAGVHRRRPGRRRPRPSVKGGGTRGRTSPLRSRPRRTCLHRRGTGEPFRDKDSGITLGSQTDRPGRGRSRVDRHPARSATAAGTRRPGSADHRPARTVRRRLDHPQGPQTAAPHPHRRRHPAPGNRQRHRPDRDQLAHRRHRRDHHRPAHPPRNREEDARRRGRVDPPHRTDTPATPTSSPR